MGTGGHVIASQEHAIYIENVNQAITGTCIISHTRSIGKICKKILSENLNLEQVSLILQIIRKLKFGPHFFNFDKQ